MIDIWRTLLLGHNELTRRIRNRSAIVTAFVGPLALAIVFSLLVGGATSGSFVIGVVDLDGSQTTRSIVDGFAVVEDREEAGSDAVRFEERGTPDVAREDVDGDDLDAAVILPDGFEQSAQRGALPTVTVLRSPDRPIAGQVAESIGLAVTGEVERVGLALRTLALVQGESPGDELVSQVLAQPPALTLAELELDGSEVSTSAFYGAAMSILFLFFTVGFAARSLLAERRDGTLARILATPTRPGSVVAGKTLAVSLLGLAGFVTVWLVTSLGFDADWGNPLGVILVMLATVFAIAGVATLVASLAKTEQQADAYTSVVTFALALLGGNFVGPGQGPSVLQTLSLLTPNGWSLRAFTELSADAATLGSVLGGIGILLAFGAVFGIVGLVRVQRIVSV